MFRELPSDSGAGLRPRCGLRAASARDARLKRWGPRRRIRASGPRRRIWNHPARDAGSETVLPLNLKGGGAKPEEKPKEMFISQPLGSDRTRPTRPHAASPRLARTHGTHERNETISRLAYATNLRPSTIFIVLGHYHHPRFQYVL